jgi:chromosomal replication initiator protein
MKELQGLWDNVISHIRSTIPERDYSLWIQPLRISAIREEEAFILAPNKFVAQWVSDNYRRIILEGFAIFNKSIEKINITYDSSSKDSPIIRNRAPKAILSNIRPAYTFSSYVGSRSNSFALEVAKAVSESPGLTYNPVYIFSQNPSGKTHLLHAIGNRLLSRTDIQRPIYLSCKDKKRLFSALRSLDPIEISAFLLDDIDDSGLTLREQERIIAFIDKLQNRNIQIVFAGRAHPSELKGISRALASRIMAGVLCPMGEYDIATRIEILRGRSSGKASLPEGLLEQISLSYIDIKICITNLVKIQTLLSLSKSPLEGEAVRATLSSTSPPDGHPDAGGILSQVCRYFDISLEDITSPRRGRSVTYPRKIAIYLLKTISLFKSRDIARIFSFKDPSPVYRTLKHIEIEMKNQEVIKRDLAVLRQAITGCKSIEPFS